jgi:hypothetical protein
MALLTELFWLMPFANEIGLILIRSGALWQSSARTVLPDGQQRDVPIFLEAWVAARTLLPEWQ